MKKILIEKIVSSIGGKIAHLRKQKDLIFKSVGRESRGIGDHYPQA